MQVLAHTKVQLHERTQCMHNGRHYDREKIPIHHTSLLVNQIVYHPHTLTPLRTSPYPTPWSPDAHRSRLQSKASPSSVLISQSSRSSPTIRRGVVGRRRFLGGSSCEPSFDCVSSTGRFDGSGECESAGRSDANDPSPFETSECASMLISPTEGDHAHGECPFPPLNVMHA